MGWIVFILLIAGVVWAIWSMGDSVWHENSAMPAASDPVRGEDLRPNTLYEDPEDNEERYRQHLSHLISRTKSRGNTRYFNKFVNRCRDEAAGKFPKGAAAARKKDGAAAGAIGVLGAIFALLG